MAVLNADKAMLIVAGTPGSRTRLNSAQRAAEPDHNYRRPSIRNLAYTTGFICL